MDPSTQTSSSRYDPTQSHPLSSQTIIGFPSATALSLLQEVNDIGTLGLGCEILDEFLAGGLRLGITELSGEAGAGKTQISLQMMLNVQMPREVGGLDGAALCIYTEGEFPMSRLLQIETGYKKKFPETKKHQFLDFIIVKPAKTVTELVDVLFNRVPIVLKQQEELKDPIRLLVIDSIAAVVRAEYDQGEERQRSAVMFKISAQLRRISEKHGVRVLVVNQVSDVFDTMLQTQSHILHMSVPSTGRMVTPSLGIPWSQCINTRLFLSRRNMPRADACMCPPVKRMKLSATTQSNACGGSDLILSGAAATATQGQGERGEEKAEDVEGSYGPSSWTCSSCGKEGGREQVERRLHVIHCPYLPTSHCLFQVHADGVSGVSDSMYWEE